MPWQRRSQGRACTDPRLPRGRRWPPYRAFERAMGAIARANRAHRQIRVKHNRLETPAPEFSYLEWQPRVRRAPGRVAQCDRRRQPPQGGPFLDKPGWCAGRARRRTSLANRSAAASGGRRKDRERYGPVAPKMDLARGLYLLSLPDGFEYPSRSELLGELAAGDRSRRVVGPRFRLGARRRHHLARGRLLVRLRADLLRLHQRRCRQARPGMGLPPRTRKTDAGV
jgi:hypothetical protein